MTGPPPSRQSPPSNNKNNNNKSETKSDSVSKGVKIATTALANNLVTYLIEPMVRRYHLDENDDYAHNDNDKNNTRKRSLDANIDNLVEPPSLQNEVEEYRRYGLEVARNIQNIMRGDCATSVHTTTTNHEREQQKTQHTSKRIEQVLTLHRSRKSQKN